MERKSRHKWGRIASLKGWSVTSLYGIQGSGEADNNLACQLYPHCYPNWVAQQLLFLVPLYLCIHYFLFLESPFLSSLQDEWTLINSSGCRSNSWNTSPPLPQVMYYFSVYYYICMTSNADLCYGTQALLFACLCPHLLQILSCFRTASAFVCNHMKQMFRKSLWQARA